MESQIIVESEVDNFDLKSSQSLEIEKNKGFAIVVFISFLPLILQSQSLEIENY